MAELPAQGVKLARGEVDVVFRARVVQDQTVAWSAALAPLRRAA
ncbi:hypothetical protein [Herbidospora galbida]|nr:hypothetical protein [Herbidospora galbida]